MSQGITPTEAIELWQIAQELEDEQGKNATDKDLLRICMRIVSHIRGYKLESFRNRPACVTCYAESSDE